MSILKWTNAECQERAVIFCSCREVPCRMSILRNRRVALSILRAKTGAKTGAKTHLCVLFLLDKPPVGCSYVILFWSRTRERNYRSNIPYDLSRIILCFSYWQCTLAYLCMPSMCCGFKTMRAITTSYTKPRTYFKRELKLYCRDLQICDYMA